MGELIQNGTSQAPLALPFCAAADIELWRPQFFILASTWRKLACLGLIQADIRTTASPPGSSQCSTAV